MPLTLLLAGATGLVGSKVLAIALEDPRVSRVIVSVRRPLPAHPKLDQWVDKDLEKALQDVPVDAVICCLGTTIKKVGGDKAKFIHVDKELVLALGKWALGHRAHAFCAVSSMGADAGSRIFYNRVKGETEDGLRALGLPALHLFRPSILTGPREEVRIGERIGIGAMRLLAPLMIGPARDHRPMPHDTLAKALMNAALGPSKGTHVYTHDAILDLAST